MGCRYLCIDDTLPDLRRVNGTLPDTVCVFVRIQRFPKRRRCRSLNDREGLAAKFHVCSLLIHLTATDHERQNTAPSLYILQRDRSKILSTDWANAFDQLTFNGQ